MGVVYRAHDPRIGRDVAIKVLPSDYASDRDRLNRFQIEARSAGMLHHPNLLTVFDLGSDNGAPYIVAELLDGETLRAKLDAGPVPFRKAVDYAKQIASGLAAAHDKGIVHRDLKPENIFVTRDGQVKILDFGLAKLSPPPSASSATMPRATTPGTVLGTIGYMSPEQVRGEDVDHRSDIFALGSILYEMVTGRPAFAGQSAPEVMTAILREDPAPIVATNVPAALGRIIGHTLEKSAAERFQSARDLAFDLDTLVSGSVPAVHPVRWRRYLGALIAAAALAIGFAGGIAMRRWRTEAVAPRAISQLTYSGQDMGPSVSRDGRSMVFTSTRDGRSRIWLHDLATGGEVPLTEGPDRWPRFSPDGASILFIRDAGVAHGSVWRTGLVGGTPRKIIADADSADWSNDGSRIIYTRHPLNAPQQTILCTASADGAGEITLATIGWRHMFPRYSPDGKWIALTESAGGSSRSMAFLISADGKTQRPINSDRLTYSGLSTRTWLDDRHLLYGSSTSSIIYMNIGEILVLDTQTRTTHPVLQTAAAVAGGEVAGEGRLVFGTMFQRQSLREIPLDGLSPRPVWRTRGNANDRQPAYAPDGSRIAFSSNRSGNLDLWTVSTKDGSIARLTDDKAIDYDPAFTPDGAHVLWSSDRSGSLEIWMADADGSGAHQISKDGLDAENPTATANHWIIYNSYNPQKRGIWKMRADGSDLTHVVDAPTELPDVSTDGKYVCYSRLPPRSEIEVVRLNDGKRFTVAKLRGPSFQIGAGRCRWSADAKSVAWIDLNESNEWKVFVQRFEFGEDTSVTRRELGGADAANIESFGFSPDGKSAVISVLDEIDTIYMAEGVPGIHPLKRP